MGTTSNTIYRFSSFRNGIGSAIATLCFVTIGTSPCSAEYFTGGPTNDVEGNVTRSSMEAALEAFTQIQKAEMKLAEEQRTESEKKMMEAFGKEVSVDIKGPLSDDAISARAQTDAGIAAAIGNDGRNSELAQIIKQQAEQHRRIILFNERIKALSDGTKQPLNFGGQLTLWSELKKLNAEIVLSQLAEMNLSAARRAKLEAEKRRLMQDKHTRDKVNKTYGN